MTSSFDEANARGNIPAGMRPGWETRYPGRLEFELKALRKSGIEPEIDDAALEIGQLALNFDWRLESGGLLALRAVYPDSFPHFRPQVFLLPGIDPWPVRHCDPIGGNLCLLGRDSSQWSPSWTLHRLLEEQLENALNNGGEEDPQGEPAEFWWNAQSLPDSFCLIDSAWDLGKVSEGLLDLRFVTNEQNKRNRNKIPGMRAYISEIRDKDKNVIHRWDAPLPPDLATATSKIRVPWVKVEGTIMPERDREKQLKNLWQQHPTLQQSRPQKHSPGLMIRAFVVAHSVELGFGEFGLSWIPLLLFGEPKAFSSRTARKKRNGKLGIASLPVYRAGLGDIGHRVPSVKILSRKRVLVVGTGAVGAPVAIELARNGCEALHIIENDIVEPGNSVRWPLGASTWGRHKIDAIAEFLMKEYPGTELVPHRCCLGQPQPTAEGLNENNILDGAIDDVDIVIDGSASHGVTALLADRCRGANVPLISLFATPTLEGGAVVRHTPDGGCPTCLEYMWYQKLIPSPPGRGCEEGLTQPPGCAERTFVGAGYDLQELSLQAVRLSVETLKNKSTMSSIIQTLSFIDESGNRCPPRWRIDPLPKHPDCGC